MNSSQVPVARNEGLVIQEMPDEVLVYDLEDNKAFCLNPTAAEIWKSCDGIKTVAEIASDLNGGRDQATNEDVVWLALEQLKEKNLLKNEVSLSLAGQSRREMIKKVGLATAIALPVIAMLSFPGQTLASTCNQSACNSVDSNVNGCAPGQVCCPNVTQTAYGCFVVLGPGPVCGGANVEPGSGACP